MNLLNTIYNIRDYNYEERLRLLQQHERFSRQLEDQALNNIVKVCLMELEKNNSIEINFSHSISAEEKSKISRRILRTICSLINENTIPKFSSEDSFEIMNFILTINRRKINDGIFSQDDKLVLLLEHSKGLSAQNIFVLLYSLMGSIEEKRCSPPEKIHDKLLTRLIDPEVNPSPKQLRIIVWKIACIASKINAQPFNRENIFNLLNSLISFDETQFMLQDISLPIWTMGRLIDDNFLIELPHNIINSLLKKLFKKNQITQKLYLNDSLETNFEKDIIANLEGNNMVNLKTHYAKTLTQSLSNIFYGLEQYMKSDHWNLDPELFQALLNQLDPSESGLNIAEECDSKHIRTIFCSLAVLSDKDFKFDLGLSAVTPFSKKLYDELDLDGTRNKKDSIMIIRHYFHPLAHLVEGGHIKELDSRLIGKIVRKFSRCKGTARDVSAFLQALSIFVERGVLKEFHLKSKVLKSLIKRFNKDRNATTEEMYKTVKSCGIISSVCNISTKSKTIRTLINRAFQQRVVGYKVRDLLMGAGLLGLEVKKNVHPSNYNSQSRTRRSDKEITSELFSKLTMQHIGRKGRKIEDQTIHRLREAYAKFYKCDLASIKVEVGGTYKGFYFDAIVSLGPYVKFLHKFNDFNKKDPSSKRKEECYDRIIKNKYNRVVAYTHRSIEHLPTVDEIYASIEQADPYKYQVIQKPSLVYEEESASEIRNEENNVDEMILTSELDRTSKRPNPAYEEELGTENDNNNVEEAKKFGVNYGQFEFFRSQRRYGKAEGYVNNTNVPGSPTTTELDANANPQKHFKAFNELQVADDHGVSEELQSTSLSLSK